MAITIRYKKVVKDGKKFVEILELGALPFEKLPSEYTDYLVSENRPYLYFSETDCCPKHSFQLRQKNDITDENKTRHKWSDLRIGDIVPIGEFNEYKKILRECGNRLQKINRKLREEKLLKEWHGEETITI